MFPSGTYELRHFPSLETETLVVVAVETSSKAGTGVVPSGTYITRFPTSENVTLRGLERFDCTSCARREQVSQSPHHFPSLETESLVVVALDCTSCARREQVSQSPPFSESESESVSRKS